MFFSNKNKNQIEVLKQIKISNKKLYVFYIVALKTQKTVQIKVLVPI